MAGDAGRSQPQQGAPSLRFERPAERAVERAVLTLKRPDWALLEVVALWLSVALLIVVSGRRDRAAGWLLVPYLAWVAFAGVLNWSVVRLNEPFAGP